LCAASRRREPTRCWSLHVVNIAEGAGCGTNAEFARFVGYAYRSLKEVITCIELCERIYRTIPRAALEKLVDEGTQISRMTHTFMQRL
jgi:four helix bundle protein